MESINAAIIYYSATGTVHALDAARHQARRAAAAAFKAGHRSS